MSKKLTLDIILSQSAKNNPNITSLNVCGNNITDISLLAQYPSLEVISLSNNNIKNLNVFKNLKNLKKLNLKDNKISDFNQIEPLKNCKQLESLSLKDNPITKEQNYQKRIKEILPQLKRLDDIELNKIINKEIKISIKNDKKIDKLNMITSKLIKFKNTKTKNSQSPFKQKIFSGSPMRQPKLKSNNNNNVDNNININILNSSGKKNVKENKSLNNSNKKNEINNKSIDKNNENSTNKNNSKNNVIHNQNNQNEEDLFENININDEKKKLEIVDKDNEPIKNSSKKNLELLSYSFKKKKTSGYFYKFKKKSDNNNAEVNATLDNIKIDNQLINTFNDENKNINYNLNNSRYSRKIIGKFPGTHNLLSQSIRYDDDNDDDINNDLRFSQKNKLGSIKNRLFNKITNQIMNSNKNNNNAGDDEKIIIKSIKLLLGNLGREELEQINKDLVNAISKINK